jgi:hypothetical protein
MKEVKEKLLVQLTCNVLPRKMLSRDSKRTLLKRREVSSVLTRIYSLMNERKSLRIIVYATASLDSY